MCCFSREVRMVADTNIFARASKGGRQFLVYSMRVDAPKELAMILPIPVPAKSAEDAVKFISLKEYDAFFTDLKKCFPEPPPPSPSRDSKRPAPKAAALPVVEVGAFAASFVPSIGDFERLDERFRLRSEVWKSLPQYSDYGFAVFQLKEGEQKVHPMAFEFPRRKADKLFFPTVHIHDGQVRLKARFDHALYCQVDEGTSTVEWDESPGHARQSVKVEKAQGLIEPDAHVYRRRLVGMLENADTWA